MESADLVIVLVVVAIGAFAGGILFGMWLVKRNQPKHESRTVVSPNTGHVLTIGRGTSDGVGTNAVPISGKFQPTAPNRIGWPALRRELEEDDPEAKRYEEIMKANGSEPMIGKAINEIKYNALMFNHPDDPIVRLAMGPRTTKETNARK